jgi:hypothetical protein
MAESAQMDKTIVNMLNAGSNKLTLAGQALFNRLYTMSSEAHTSLPTQVKQQWIQCVTQERQSTNTLDKQRTLLHNWLRTAAPKHGDTAIADDATIDSTQTETTDGTSDTATTITTESVLPFSTAP